jgi:hypothetical protein
MSFRNNVNVILLLGVPSWSTMEGRYADRDSIQYMEDFSTEEKIVGGGAGKFELKFWLFNLLI